MKNVRREDWETLKPTVCGWGINDVNYNVQISVELPKVNGKRVRKNIWVCQYYEDWYNIIRRCFDDSGVGRYATYKDCTISEEWKYLSNFVKWVDSQPNRDWQNCQLDKDFLVFGNKCYSPETVVYIPQNLNTFTTNSGKTRGSLMLGVTLTDSSTNPYRARCCDPFVVKNVSLGSCPTEIEAHKAWQAKKHEYACQLANLQDDPRVADALRQRYAPDKDWTKA